MTTQDKTVPADWFRIAEAFAQKESSTPEDVIRLVSGLRAEFEATTPAPGSQPVAAPKAVQEDTPARSNRAKAQAADRKPSSSAPAPAPKRPAVPIEKAVTDDMVYCLECGRGMKMLKRHLGSTHGMTPHEYRARWDLPEDFPITAPNYTAAKSDTAKAMDFGKGSPKTGKTASKTRKAMVGA
ncbi:MucR family transcriptional regulator [Citreimonas salinaria]|uniref:ROS/MUCR transcriptional regulator protein n=1 Tax=Citreimonas salinaria TaxID=321339 RepID=A0A1H3LYW7_9RHOB|nr:MucR family transcriptional regulator [Citreimonas salinaria]SDY69642.1 ROS/MUCR transcriptional regulator protein [Citreimonas salinaria]